MDYDILEGEFESGNTLGTSIGINEYKYADNKKECLEVFFKKENNVSYEYSYKECEGDSPKEEDDEEKKEEVKGDKIHHLVIGCPCKDKGTVLIYNILENKPLNEIKLEKGEVKGFGTTVDIHKNFIAISTDDYNGLGVIYFYIRKPKSDEYILYNSFSSPLPQRSSFGNKLKLFEQNDKMYCFIGASNKNSTFVFNIIDSEYKSYSSDKNDNTGNDAIILKDNILVSSFHHNKLTFLNKQGDYLFDIDVKNIMINENVFNPEKYNLTSFYHQKNFNKFESWKYITRFGECLVGNENKIVTTFIANDTLFLYIFSSQNISNGKIINTNINLINSKPSLSMNESGKIYIGIMNTFFSNSIYEVNDNNVTLVDTSNQNEDVLENINQPHNFEKDDVLQFDNGLYSKIELENDFEIVGYVHEVIDNDNFVIRKNILPEDMFANNIKNYKDKLLVSAAHSNNRKGEIKKY